MSACSVLLEFLEMKDDRCVSQAAAKLTPFVECVYAGKHNFPKLRIEFVNDFKKESMNGSRVVDLCEEVGDSDEER